MRGNKKGWSKGPVVGTRRARHDNTTQTTRTKSLGKMRPGKEEELGKRLRATRDMNA